MRHSSEPDQSTTLDRRWYHVVLDSPNPIAVTCGIAAIMLETMLPDPVMVGVIAFMVITGCYASMASANRAARRARLYGFRDARWEHYRLMQRYCEQKRADQQNSEQM